MGDHPKGPSPGPWSVNEAGDVFDAEGFLVAKVQDRAVAVDGELALFFLQADAALIIAAPKLRGALQALTDSMDEPDLKCAYPNCSGCVRRRAYLAAMAVLAELKGGANG